MQILQIPAVVWPAKVSCPGSTFVFGDSQGASVSPFAIVFLFQSNRISSSGGRVAAVDGNVAVWLRWWR
ncbi:MAG TPA: hypothetical protein DCR20_06440 [Planctomycetaceae bacterium]|nr:hypothetical protein [Planctomycetaceae bacterium]